MNHKHVLAIQHIAFEDLGNLAPILKAAGYSIEYIHASELKKNRLNDPALLVILGGPIAAYQEREYPFLKNELDLLQHRLNNQLPTLGICLGAQLMARALGARVYPGKQKEIGWSTLTTKITALTHNPLAPLIESATPVLHWHGDTFDLPAGALHLASTQLYENQAFSVGNHCLGLQFHPEVSKAGMEKWFIGHAHEINHTPGISVEQLRHDTYQYADHLVQKAESLWKHWLNHLEQDNA